MSRRKKPKVSDSFAHVAVCCILAHEPDDAAALKAARRYGIVVPNRKYLAAYRAAWADDIERLRDHPLSVGFRSGLRSVSARLLGLQQVADTLMKMMERAGGDPDTGLDCDYREYGNLASKYLAFLGAIAQETERENAELSQLSGAVPQEWEIDLEDALNHAGPVDPDSQLHLRDALRRAAAATATTFPPTQSQGRVVASPPD